MKLLGTTDTTYRLQQDDGAPVDYPRVTSVLGLLRADLREIPADVLARAAARGTAVHRAIWLLEGGGDGSGLAWGTLHPELRPYVAAYQDAQAALRFRVVEAERLVVSRRYGYAGRMDLVAKWQGTFGILDIKTGINHPAHQLQVSAYREAWAEETGSRRQLRRWILYLRQSGAYRLVDCDEGSTHAADFAVFAACVRVYRWLQEQHAREETP